MYAADRSNKAEVKMSGMRGKCEPIVITQKHMLNVAAMENGELEKVETFLVAAVKIYWADLSEAAQKLGEVRLKGITAFFRKVGLLWTKAVPETTFETLRERLVAMETSLRKCLQL